MFYAACALSSTEWTLRSMSPEDDYFFPSSIACSSNIKAATNEDLYKTGIYYCSNHNLDQNIIEISLYLLYRTVRINISIHIFYVYICMYGGYQNGFSFLVPGERGDKFHQTPPAWINYTLRLFNSN